jgi:hypothetical protein
MYAAHYLVPVFPAIAALIAVGAGVITRRSRPALALVLAVTLVPALVREARERRAESSPHSRTVAKEWLIENVPTGSVVALEQGSADFRGANPTAGGFYVIDIPISVLSPELSDAFYDTTWYTGADFVVLSSLVGDRFRGEPERFSVPNAFYAWLHARWRSIDLGTRPTRGPVIEVIGNPEPEVGRADSPVPAELFEPLRACPRELVTSFLGSLAAAAHARGKVERAWSLYRGELALYPDEELALADFGALAVSLGRHVEAVSALERAVAQNPNRPASFNNLGIARLALGDSPGAREAFTRALEIDPTNERARHNLRVAEEVSAGSPGDGAR